MEKGSSSKAGPFEEAQVFHYAYLAIGQMKRTISRKL